MKLIDVFKGKGYNPNRVPKGGPGGGRFTSGSGGVAQGVEGVNPGAESSSEASVRRNRAEDRQRQGMPSDDYQRSAKKFDENKAHRMDEQARKKDMSSTDFEIHLERDGKVSKLPGELTIQVKSNKLRDVGDDLMDSDDLIPEGHSVIATVNGRQYNLTDGWEYMGPAPRRRR